MIDKLGLKICFIVFSSLTVFIVLGHNEMQKQNEILDIIDVDVPIPYEGILVNYDGIVGKYCTVNGAEVWRDLTPDTELSYEKPSSIDWDSMLQCVGDWIDVTKGEGNIRYLVCDEWGLQSNSSESKK